MCLGVLWVSQHHYFTKGCLYYMGSKSQFRTNFVFCILAGLLFEGRNAEEVVFGD